MTAVDTTKVVRIVLLAGAFSATACDAEEAGPRGVPPSPTGRAATCDASTADHTIPVLVLRYLPTADGVRLDAEEAGSGEALATLRARIDEMTATTVQALEDGSRYHGYADPSAPCALDYEIVDDIEYLEALPPAVATVPWNSETHRPNYSAILQREQICDLVEQAGVREVWLWGYHHGIIEPAESNMAGPNGDISNSERIDDMPVCATTYTLYNYNFARGAGEAVHDHGHQIENVMLHFDAETFDDWRYPKGDSSGTNGCGDVHFPPNTQDDYDYADPAVMKSDCASWRPGGGGSPTDVSCADWGCDGDPQLDYLVWWMQNLPGRDNGLGVGNWWDGIGDFDGVVAHGFDPGAAKAENWAACTAGQECASGRCGCNLGSEMVCLPSADYPTECTFECDFACADYGYAPDQCVGGWECGWPCIEYTGCGLDKPNWEACTADDQCASDRCGCNGGSEMVCLPTAEYPKTCAEAPSCAGSCGDNAGSCWCDAACVDFGDCCADACSTCGAC